MKLGADDGGTRQSVHRGERITISLPETATTGYRWRFDSTADFDEVGAETIAPNPAAPGASGTRIFTLIPRRTGTLQLRLVKRRSWEQESSTEFTVLLDVVESD